MQKVAKAVVAAAVTTGFSPSKKDGTTDMEAEAATLVSSSTDLQ
jgi:hypothetical protein